MTPDPQRLNEAVAGAEEADAQEVAEVPLEAGEEAAPMVAVPEAEAAGRARLKWEDRDNHRTGVIADRARVDRPLASRRRPIGRKRKTTLAGE